MDTALHARNADPYRGPWSRDDPEAGKKYAADVKDLIVHATPGCIAGFFAESIQGLGGTVVFPETDIGTETTSFLKEWLITHILESDKHLGGFLEGRTFR